MEDEIIVTFIKDNCYSVEIGDYFLVFDYYRGILNIPDDKKTIFVVSSKEEGHYTSEILKLYEMENFTYILNSDIAYDKSDGKVIYLKSNNLSIENLKNLYRAKNVRFIEGDKNYWIGKDIEINTFELGGGLSLILSIGDINILYLATGLVNETLDEEDLEGLLDLDYDIDLAFVPILDKNLRLRTKRVERLVDMIRPQIVFPIGFNNREDLSQELYKNIDLPYSDFRYIGKDIKSFVIDIDKDIDF
ncbi:MBL fold metallo-hydrolase [Anaerococcus sp. AGMB09787]|uniref:MBL fold metallo-hydrolase n=1 Tax=Anaerococcus sp. AGMB09787 TaxID=2922869 RepID=UPI001FAF3702|nr:MBL fold metallo-hydrolase [Anaerococcus sp. AGMB09787]